MYDTDVLSETYTLEFEEFTDESVDDLPVDGIQPTADEVEVLQIQLSAAEDELIEKRSVEQLNLAQKELIIELRKQLGEDEEALGFRDEYPYDALRLDEDDD